MSDDRVTVPLGELCTQTFESVPVVADQLYTNLGVRWYARGVFERSTKTGSEIKASRLFQVRPRQFIYNRLFATEGSFALVPDDCAHGVVSNEFPVFDVDSERLLPEFLALYFGQESVWERVAGECVGTTHSRSRWKEERFSAYRLPLPPLADQRRIIDLIAAIDDTLAATEDTLKGASRLLDSLREDFYVTGSMPSKPLGTLAVMRSGPSWKAADESPSRKEGYAPVLGITNTPAGRRLDLLQQKFVRGLPRTVLRLNDSSLIMIRTNGNRARIGNVYRATAAVAGYAVSAFQIAIEPRRVTDSPFLYWILGTPSIQQHISEAASGSTGLGNVAIGWLKELVIPYSEGSVQVADFVETCETIAAVADEAQVEANSLQVLRSELLTALLSGEHDIPESYDELIGA